MEEETIKSLQHGIDVTMHLRIHANPGNPALIQEFEDEAKKRPDVFLLKWAVGAWLMGRKLDLCRPWNISVEPWEEEVDYPKF